MRFVPFALLALAVPAFAAPPAPTVEVRVRPINDLLGTLEYVGGIVDEAEHAKQLAALVKSMTGPKGLEGLDPKKPLGAYGVVTPNVVDSPVVLLVPVADKDAVLNLLTGRLNLDPKKADDGIYEVQLPNAPDPVFFTFADDYLYVTYRAKKPLDKDERIAPKTFFAKDEPALVAVALHIDRVPADIRRTVLGQFEHQIALEKELKNPGDTAAGHRLKGILLDGAVAAVAGLFDDGRTLAVKLSSAPKTDEIALTAALTAADGSAMKTAFASAAGRKAVAPLAAAGAKPAMTASANFGLPEKFLAKINPVIDEIFKESVAAAKPDEREYAKKVLDAIAPTLKAGVVEFGGGFFAASDGKFTGTAALRVVEGKGIEDALKAIAPFAPADQAKFSFDTGKVGTASLHAVELIGADAKKMFTTETLKLATSEKLLGVAIGDAGFKAFTAAEPKAGPVIAVEIGTVAAAYLFEKTLKPSTIRALAADVFEDGGSDGKDRIALTATGGEQLTVTFTVKGKAAAFLAAVDKAKKQ